MNLLILVAIVSSQLIFQAIYFEKYYLGQKRELLEKSIEKFENILIKDKNPEKIMSFIQKVKDEDNIELSYINLNLQDGIGLEPYMGDRYLLIKSDKNNNEYKVVLGGQFELGDSATCC